MATVMIQTQSVSSDARSPRSLLKVGSPTGEAAWAVSKSLKAGATGVFDLSPETALQLLCNNIEKLNVYFAEDPEQTDLTPYVSTPAGADATGNEDVKSVGLHCGDQGGVTDRSQE